MTISQHQLNSYRYLQYLVLIGLSFAFRSTILTEVPVTFVHENLTRPLPYFKEIMAASGKSCLSHYAIEYPYLVTGTARLLNRVDKTFAQKHAKVSVGSIRRS